MNDNTTQHISIKDKQEPSLDIIENKENIDSDFKNDRPDTLIIKGKFKFENNNVYGIFAFLLDMNIIEETPETTIHNSQNSTYNHILSTFILASYFRDLYNLDLTTSWITLEKTFNQIHISGEYAQSVTKNIQKTIENTLNRDHEIATILLNYNLLSDKNSIATEITQFLNPVYSNSPLSVEVELEELHKADIESIKQHRIIEEEPEANYNILNTPTIHINPMDYNIPAKPILAPTGKGISVSQLSIDNRILMMVEHTSYGQNWIDKFQLLDKKTNKIYPLIGTVEQIGPIIKNSIDVLVRYQPNQYSRFNLESNVKIKLYNPQSLEPTIDPIIDSIDPFDSASKLNTLSVLLQSIEFRILLTSGALLTITSFIALYFISL